MLYAWFGLEMKDEYSLKLPIMPLTARDLEEKRARLGLVERVKHDLLQQYHVLHKKTG
ncbi:ERBB-3 BINDING PROTEIN 1 isoform X1 [Iris pallida]|uniref:ERBB-3 BINDING PROTEIN 1 isoform X1 n=1 Tax=Iris pallida TaxID=29817 RepID=A0AAX6E749_IRIPA|nr:ERBB-3 BINDING PROTEIN 1 isoform X1 [Iris pallida]